MAFIPAAVVIKPMTFRRLAEGGLLLAAAPMHSRTRRYARSSMITAAEYQSKNRKARCFVFLLFVFSQKGRNEWRRAK